MLHAADLLKPLCVVGVPPRPVGQVVVADDTEAEFLGVACEFVLAYVILFLWIDVWVTVVQHRTYAVIEHPLKYGAAAWGATAMEKII